MADTTPRGAVPTEPPDPGQAWMLAFQRGDDAAFTQIVVHYGARVAAFFRRAGADASSAEDLAQEAFLRIARARDRYEATAKFTTWLHRILFRIAMNDGTRNRWRRALSFERPRELEAGDAPALPELVDDAAPPAEAASIDELRERVRAAVGELPEPQRTALLLHRFEGCSYDDVAATLQEPAPAAHSAPAPSLPRGGRTERGMERRLPPGIVGVREAVEESLICAAFMHAGWE